MYASFFKFDVSQGNQYLKECFSYFTIVKVYLRRKDCLKLLHLFRITDLAGLFDRNKDALWNKILQFCM